MDGSVSTSGPLKNPREFHHKRRAGRVVVSPFAESTPIHVGTDDVHFIRARRPDLRAVHLLSRTGTDGLRVERAKGFVRLRRGIVIGRGPPRDAPQSEPPTDVLISPLAITAAGGGSAPGAWAGLGDGGSTVNCIRSVAQP